MRTPKQPRCKRCREPIPATHKRWGLCDACGHAAIVRTWPHLYELGEEAELRHTTTICDRCGAAVPENFSVVSVVAGPLRDRLDVPKDLCPDCADSFASWLATKPELTPMIAPSVLPPIAGPRYATPAT
jgi:ribosomal protein L37E